MAAAENSRRNGSGEFCLSRPVASLNSPARPYNCPPSQRAADAICVALYKPWLPICWEMLGVRHFDSIRLRSVSANGGKWSGGRREAFSESEPERNARRRAQTEARRFCGPLRMPARNERADLRSGAGVVEGRQGDGQPAERSKPRVGSGGKQVAVELTTLMQPQEQVRLADIFVGQHSAAALVMESRTDCSHGSSFRA